MTTTRETPTDGVVTLRALEPDDAPALLAGEDDDLVRWLSGARGTVDGVRRWIDDCAATWTGDWYAPGAALAWALCDASTAEVVGTLEVELSAVDLEPGEANLSYGVLAGRRGHHYAARGVALVLPWLAAHTGTATAVIRVDPANVHSLRVPLDAGFRRAGRTRRGARFVAPIAR
ncbi:GNAT family N-acetyltransferase [Actinomycetospora termitidis]|uniref:GNAT family N-acetyltransferase n=1 Tax=Actinomycetospora termitidis TaxID=3053470 RepID=A0ABT7MDB5_9PSEU|nr:GNAT family N-acetyltransferase [Actinomycetospora sp. Odt1-22]MDL5158650.1 GNAT family N-acetyltransferase [Actinomycetospora sp. Odt1-22]